MSLINSCSDKCFFIYSSLTSCFTPLNIYNGTPEGRLNRDLREQLPTNELKGKPPMEVCPILNLYRFKKNSNNTVNNRDQYLENIEYKDAQKFIPPISRGKVVKVYDGDTITIATQLDTNTNEKTPIIYRFSIRLLGIDTPEIKGHSKAEKEAATKARDALDKKIAGKIVDLKNISIEKYGRVLANVHLDGEDISEWLIKNHFAVKYDGGTKHDFFLLST